MIQVLRGSLGISRFLPGIWGFPVVCKDLRGSLAIRDYHFWVSRDPPRFGINKNVEPILNSIAQSLETGPGGVPRKQRRKNLSIQILTKRSQRCA